MKEKRIYHNNLNEQEVASTIKILESLVGSETFNELDIHKIKAKRLKDGDIYLESVTDDEIYTMKYGVKKKNGFTFISGAIDYDNGDCNQTVKKPFQIFDVTEQKDEQRILAVVLDGDIGGYLQYPKEGNFHGLIPIDATLIKTDEDIADIELGRIGSRSYIKEKARFLDGGKRVE